MGIDHFGEMHRLADIARPDVCVITNIGYAHLESLGSREGILKAKTEMFDHLQDEFCVVLNGDDDMLRTVSDVRGQKPVFFGIDSAAPVFASHIENRGLKGLSLIHIYVFCPKSFDDSVNVRMIHDGRRIQLFVDHLCGDADGRFCNENVAFWHGRKAGKLFPDSFCQSRSPHDTVRDLSLIHIFRRNKNPEKAE